MVADDAILSLRILSNSTSEHEVRYHGSGERVLKTTWAGCYGQVPVIRDGKLEREMATPAEYLVRIGLDNAVFDGKIELEGIHVSDRPSLVIGEPAGQPSFVVSQPLYQAANLEQPSPSLDDIDTFLRQLGFLPVQNPISAG